jgi:hypothetical protein
MQKITNHISSAEVSRGNTCIIKQLAIKNDVEVTNPHRGG